jgi:hypothetical protein
MKYTVNYFIKKFSRIPHSKWTTGVSNDGKGRRCALGHCTDTNSNKVTEISSLFNIFYENNLVVSAVNDGVFTEIVFKGKHPRTRILNALRYIKRVS